MEKRLEIRVDELGDKEVEFDFEERREAITSANSYGHSVIKTLLLANGAAAVATLALINSLIGKTTPETSEVILSVWPCLLLFAVGVLCSGLTGWASYMAESYRAHTVRRPIEYILQTQAMLHRALDNPELAKSQEKTVDECAEERERHSIVCQRWTWAAQFTGWGSALCFLGGIIWGVYGLRASALMLTA